MGSFMPVQLYQGLHHTSHIEFLYGDFVDKTAYTLAFNQGPAGMGGLGNQV